MSNNLVTQQAVLRGIEDGKRAYCGPHTVQIDLTDKCNNTCIGCWVHSPLIDKEEVFPKGYKELSFSLVKKFINQLHRMGTREIILSGSGEPFLYPRIFEIIKLIKSKGIYLNIITNGILVNKEASQVLVKAGVDLITASIWAGTHKAYSATHPGKGVKDFEELKDNFKTLASCKQRFSSLLPYVKIYNVICRSNCREIEAMVDFAKEIDADAIEFQTIDIIKGKTDKLALNKEAAAELLFGFEKISSREDFIQSEVKDIRRFLDDKDDTEEKDFGKVWKNYKKGFTVFEKIKNIACSKGNLCKKGKRFGIESSSTHSRDILFKFFFDTKKCAACEDFSLCFPSGKCFVDVKVLSVLGLKSFIRRVVLSEAEHKVYEKQVNTIPCYIGWYYARILTDGSVIPCCKAVKLPLGSLYKTDFSSIWHSSPYEEFRLKAKNLPKNDKYFSTLNCIKSCDNWGMNLEIEKTRKEFPEKNVCKDKKKVNMLTMQKQRRRAYRKELKRYVLREGFKETIKRIVYNITPKNLKDRYLEILGIYDKKFGYKGPFHVQIDLTNNCNNNCIACWCNSPLFKVPRFSEDEKKQYLPFEVVKELLDEISHMGAVEVYYSGGGEPFMHPQIMEILEYTKKKNLICHVNTNFTLLNRESLNQLISIGIDFLTVSTWAATADTYVKTHPGRSSRDFYKIKENLIYLNTRKKNKPCIKLYNVIFNMNYFEIQEMVEFAGETKSESLEFTVVDTMPGVTDSLSLNEGQLKQLKDSCAEIQSGLNKQNKFKKNNVLIFQFDQFLRRISLSNDVKQAKYDRNIINNMPCYIGWLFARVVPNGEVHSCLKAHRIPTGSLYANRFFEIWNSKKQKYFRKKTLTCKKSDPFFKLIGNDPGTKEAGCYKSCDDIGRNTWIYNRLRMLSFPEKVLLKSIANGLKIARKMMPQKKKSYQKYHKAPTIAGIVHGRKAFEGPEQVVIDPTNRCNLRCISCWLYSPLLNEDKPSRNWLKKELSKDALFKLIEGLSSLGTKRIRFTGGGEPFMHKDLMEVIEFARKKQLQVAVTTNFGVISRGQIKRLIDLGLEELCISVWGSNSRVYSQVHPETSSAYFEKLKENLTYLKEIRKHKPRITFANVIMNTNFRDFESMYEFGLKYKTDALYFTLVDVFLGQTDVFLLNIEERKELFRKALEIKERSKKDNVYLESFEGFLRRLSMSQDDFKKGEYDKAIINKIPCYAGWIFSRILADGSVAPCCRGVKKIMGNINEKSFKDIWYSSEYNEFRAKAKYLPKENSYFKDIGCTKECDNLMHNERIHKELYSA